MSKRKRKQLSKHCQVDVATQEARLASLRGRLGRIRTDPLMGQLAPALTRMLDAGQVICSYESVDGVAELMFSAKVTPAEIRELLPLVTHPVPYSTLRFFLEGMLNVAAEDEGSDALAFVNSEQFLRLPEHELGNGIYRSGVEDPAWLEAAIRRSVSEIAVAEAIGFPVSPTADGWIYPRIGHRSIGVMAIDKPGDPVSFPAIEDFRDDIVVVAHPVAETETVHLVGWLDLESFRKEQTRQQKGGAMCCVVTQDKLFPMSSLIELAGSTPAFRAQ